MVSRKWLNMKNINIISSLTFLLIYPHHRKWGKTAVKMIWRIASKKIPWDPLFLKMITPEVKDMTSWDTACSRKSVHPRTSDNPCDKKWTKGQEIYWQNFQTIRNNKNTGDLRGILAVKGEQIARKQYFEGTPRTDNSRFSRSDTDEKPAQINIQVWGYTYYIVHYVIDICAQWSKTNPCWSLWQYPEFKFRSIWPVLFLHD